MNTLKEFIKNNEASFRQEELLLEATELLVSIMEENGITRTELARRIGKSKAFVTQCLSGDHNLTLRTLADLFTALEYKANLGAEPSNPACKVLPRLYSVSAWALETSTIDVSEVIDCAASADLAEDELCAA
jgi:transcriptional regulator with XRE-family HTH domain